jgi:hypothetical protein
MTQNQIRVNAAVAAVMVPATAALTKPVSVRHPTSVRASQRP